MQAVIQSEYGSAEVLEVGEVSPPVVGDRDVLVAVRASPVTFGDRRLRAADFPPITRLPGRLMVGLLRPRHRTPGTMFAGRVVATGSAVSRFAVGDDVFGSCDHGAQAALLAAPEDGPIARMPAGVSYEDAAATPYGAVTALYFLRELGAVSAGERVAIVGAAGGVGRFAVQVAKHAGAEVTAVCSRRSFDLVRSLGADHLVDRASEDFTRSDERWDIVFDTAGATSFGACRRVLTATGRYLTLEISLGLLYHAARAALFGGPRALSGVALGDRDDLETVRDLLEQGALRPLVRETFPLSRIARAHEAAERRGADGSVVVTVGEGTEPARLACISHPSAFAGPGPRS